MKMSLAGMQSTSREAFPPPQESRHGALSKLDSGHYVLKIPRGGKSLVWKMFLNIISVFGNKVDFVLCRYCCGLFMYKGYASGTSSLMNHGIRCQERPVRTSENSCIEDLRNLSKPLLAERLEDWPKELQNLPYFSLTFFKNFKTSLSSDGSNCSNDDIAMNLSVNNNVTVKSEASPGYTRKSPTGKMKSEKMKSESVFENSPDLRYLSTLSFLANNFGVPFITGKNSDENAGSNDGSNPVSSMQEGQSSDSPSGSMNSLEAAVMAVAAAAAAANPPMNATGMEERDNDSGASNLGISNVSGNAFGEMEDRQSGLDSSSGNPLQLQNSIGSPFGTTPSRSSSNGVAPIDQNAENYQLRHNNHMNMIFSQLAEDETFMDVTLTAEGKSIKAHRSVLSAVSPYFSDVLRANPCQHPIVIMPRDVTYSELSNMIMYIYRGEITVSAGDLPSLLKTAQVLQITGLSGSNFTTPQSNKNVPAANRNPLSQANSTNNNVSPSFSSNSIPFSQSALKNIFSSNYNAMSKQSQNKSTLNHKVQTSAPRLSNASSKSCINDKTPFNIEQNDSNDQPMLNPTDFMDLDMTCVKEELQSDTEDDRSEHMDASSTPKEVTTPPPVQRPSLSTSPSTTSSSRSLDVAKVGEQTKPKDSCSDLEKELKQQDSLKTLANLANMNSITPSPPNNVENGSKSPESTQKAEFDPSPNICPYCLNYISTTELSSHMTNKHAVKPAFICTTCNRVYTRKNPYEVHCKQCKSDES